MERYFICTGAKCSSGSFVKKKDIEVFTTDDAGIYFQLIKGYYGTTTKCTRIHLITRSRHFRPR